MTGCFPCGYCSISSCYERFAGNFSLIVVIQSLSKWPHSASSLADMANSSWSGAFQALILGGDPASGDRARRAREPEVTHGAALVRAQSPFGFSPHRKKLWLSVKRKSQLLFSGYSVRRVVCESVRATDRKAAQDANELAGGLQEAAWNYLQIIVFCRMHF